MGWARGLSAHSVVRNAKVSHCETVRNVSHGLRQTQEGESTFGLTECQCESICRLFGSGESFSAHCNYLHLPTPSAMIGWLVAGLVDWLIDALIDSWVGCLIDGRTELITEVMLLAECK